MADTSEERAIAAYQAVRAHELMLNEAVSRFEHARLAPLMVLNGGAVVAFLTLLGALLGKGSGRGPDLWLSGLAAGAWVTGLLAAALAIAAAGSQQAAISAAHRRLREGLEDELLDDKLGIAKVLQGPPPSVQPPPPRALMHPAQRAKAGWMSIKLWWSGPPGSDPAQGSTSEMIGAGKRSDFWGLPRAERQEERAAARAALRATAEAHARRLKARWWLSVGMFVLGAALALAAVLSGDPIATSARTSAMATHLTPMVSAPTKQQGPLGARGAGERRTRPGRAAALDEKRR